MRVRICVIRELGYMHAYIKTRVTEKEEEIRAAMADAGPYVCY
jgi:hypothetical protein